MSADTDPSLRIFLASQGDGTKDDLSRFIEEAARAHILELSAEQAKAAHACPCLRGRSGFNLNSR